VRWHYITWQNRNMDARVNTAGGPSTSDKNLVNFGPVNPWFLQARLLWAGYTLGFATHLAIVIMLVDDVQF